MTLRSHLPTCGGNIFFWLASRTANHQNASKSESSPGKNGSENILVLWANLWTKQIKQPSKTNIPRLLIEVLISVHRRFASNMRHVESRTNSANPGTNSANLCSCDRKKHIMTINAHVQSQGCDIKQSYPTLQKKCSGSRRHCQLFSPLPQRLGPQCPTNPTRNGILDRKQSNACWIQQVKNVSNTWKCKQGTSDCAPGLHTKVCSTWPKRFLPLDRNQVSQQLFILHT